MPLLAYLLRSERDELLVLVKYIVYLIRNNNPSCMHDYCDLLYTSSTVAQTQDFCRSFLDLQIYARKDRGIGQLTNIRHFVRVAGEGPVSTTFFGSRLLNQYLSIYHPCFLYFPFLPSSSDDLFSNLSTHHPSSPHLHNKYGCKKRRPRTPPTRRCRRS